MSGSTFVRRLAALSAILLLLFICRVSAQLSLNTVLGEGSVELTISGLPQAYPGGPVVLTHPFFMNSNCKYTVNGGGDVACDLDLGIVYASFTAETWSSAPLKFVFTGLQTEMVATLIQVTVGTKDPVVLSMISTSSELNSRSSAVITMTGLLADVMVFGIFPAAPLRAQTAADQAATSKTQTILVRYPPVYNDLTGPACSVYLSATGQFSDGAPPKVNWNDPPKVTSIDDPNGSYSVVTINAIYRDVEAEDWRADAIIPVILSTSLRPLEALNSPHRAGDDAFRGAFDIFISRGNVFERFTFGGNAPSNAVAPSASIRVGSLITAADKEFTAVLTAQVEEPYNPVAMARAAVALNGLFDRQTGTITAPLITNATITTYAVPYFFPQTSSSLGPGLVTTSAKVNIVIKGKWGCLDTATNTVIDCTVAESDVCGSPGGATAVCVDSSNRILPNSVSCIGQARPLAAESYSTGGCGYWACKAPAGTAYSACGEQHLAACVNSGQCNENTSPRVWKSGSEPTCMTATGDVAATPASTCPESIVPKPEPFGACSHVDGCAILCVDQTQDSNSTHAYLTRCDDPASWTKTCLDTPAAPETRRVLCTILDETTGEQPNEFRLIVVDDALCKRFGTFPQERPCLTCVDNAWTTWVTYESTDYKVDDVKSSGNPTTAQLTDSQTCQPTLKVADISPQKSPEFYCTCDSDPTTRTLMSAADPGFTPCGNAPFRDSALTAECPQVGYEFDYLCKSLTAAAGAPLGSCDYAPGSGSGAGFEESTCPTAGCGVTTMLRAAVCATSYGVGNANTAEALTNPDACADKVQPTLETFCPPVKTTCVEVPKVKECAEVNLKTGALFSGTRSCDASLPGLTRVYVTPTECTDPVTNQTVSAALCSEVGNSDNGYTKNGNMYQFDVGRQSCILPLCAFSAREYRFTTVQGNCSTEVDGVLCRSWRTQTLGCETREVGNTDHGWEAVSTDICHAAGITVPSIEEAVQCTAPATSPCEAGSTCALYPIVTSSGKTYNNFLGVCTCPNGNVGADCDTPPSLAYLDIGQVTGRTYFSFEYELTEGMDKKIPALTFQLVRSVGGAETVVDTYVRPIVGASEIVVRFFPQPLRAGTYELRALTGGASFNKSSSFSFAAACEDQCGANGTCNINTEACDCARGFTGPACQTNLCDECSPNIQECIINDANTAVTCKCTGTFTGKFCQYNDAACESDAFPSCRPGGHREATWADPKPTCHECDCSDLFEGETCGTCPLTCSANGARDLSNCRACSCVPGYGGPECADRANFVRFVVNTRHATMSAWFTAAAAAAGGFTAQSEFRTWINTVEDALMNFLDEKLGFHVNLSASMSPFSTLAVKDSGSFVSFVDASRGKSAADSHLVAVRLTLTAFDHRDMSVTSLQALVREFGLLATGTVDGATAALKDAFTAGTLRGSTALASVDFSLGLGVQDPLCFENCPQGVGSGGVLPSEVEDDSGSSGLSDGEIAAIVVCSVVGGLLIIGLIVAAVTKSCCFKKGLARETASVSPRSAGTTSGDVEMHTAGRAEV